MSTKKPKVMAESNYEYRNKFSHKTLNFTPKPDEVVATFQPDLDEAAAHSVMGAAALSVSQGINLERGFAVFQVAPGGGLEMTSDALSSQPEIANTIPAMVDPDGFTRYFLPDEFTVQFKEGTTKQQAERLIKQKGTWIITEQRTPGYYTLAVPEGKGLFATLREFSELDEVLFAEPSEAGFNDALYIPNDPDFPELWGLHNTGQTVNGVNGTADADIDMPAAWEITRGDPQVIVAVIDTGCDQSHPDLQANYLPRGTEDWDFADAGDLVPEDTDSHGSHVAGTIAAVDNTTGVIGVAPRCRVMPLRINLAAGMNQNRADAINYVTAQATANVNRRYVVSCSWKASGDISAIQNAIINAVNHNVVVAFAAGNTYHGSVTYPARYPEPIAVASTDSRDRVTDHSAVGSEVDVCAPGKNIYSTIPQFNASGLITGHTYGFKDGTSMATPHVAGLAALVWSLNRNLTNLQVRQLIEDNCDSVDGLNPGFAGQLGRGRINARRTLFATPIGVTHLRNFGFPQPNSGSSSGMTYARLRIGSHVRSALLFLTQKPYSEKIYFLNPVTGTTLRSIDPVANDTIGSMVWDGNLIWVANVTTGSGSINAIDPRTGAQVRSIATPPGRGEGLTFDGRLMYYSTVTRIHVIDPASGTVVRSFPPPGGQCRALTYGRGYIFSGNSTSGVITVFDRNTLAVRGSIPAPGGGTAEVEGLAFNPSTNELFVANQSENRIYVLRVIV
jgi:subtilisin family serine protease